MGDVVDLRPSQLDKLKNDHEFIADLCRFAEGILTEAQVRKKYHLFTDDVWQRLGADDALVELVEAEKVRRIRSGASKREKAQLLVVQAPDVLSGILLDPAANPRHRIDSAQTLNNFATNGPEMTPATERFVIR